MAANTGNKMTGNKRAHGKDISVFGKDISVFGKDISVFEP